MATDGGAAFCWSRVCGRQQLILIYLHRRPHLHVVRELALYQRHGHSVSPRAARVLPHLPVRLTPRAYNLGYGLSEPGRDPSARGDRAYLRPDVTSAVDSPLSWLRSVCSPGSARCETGPRVYLTGARRPPPKVECRHEAGRPTAPWHRPIGGSCRTASLLPVWRRVRR